MIHVDKSLSVLDGRHELRVLSLTRAEDSFALDHTTTPPLPVRFVFLCGQSEAGWNITIGLR